MNLTGLAGESRGSVVELALRKIGLVVLLVLAAELARSGLSSLLLTCGMFILILCNFFFFVSQAIYEMNNEVYITCK